MSTDIDKVSFFELMNICENAGSMNIKRILYLILGRTIGDGFRLVCDDDTTFDMIRLYVRSWCNRHIYKSWSR